MDNGWEMLSEEDEKKYQRNHNILTRIVYILVAAWIVFLAIAMLIVSIPYFPR